MSEKRRFGPIAIFLAFVAVVGGVVTLTNAPASLCNAYYGGSIYLDGQPLSVCKTRAPYSAFRSEAEASSGDADFGDQCYADPQCPPDPENLVNGEPVGRCWAVDGSGPVDKPGVPRFCISPGKHCPFPGSLGLMADETRKIGSLTHKCEFDEFYRITSF